MRSPDPLQEVLPQASRLKELFVVRKRGAGRCSRRSRVSLARRVAVGGRGVGPIGAVAVVRQKGAQRVAAHAPDSACSSISFTQAQPPRKSGIEPHAALLDEKGLGDAFKMAAPSEGIFPLPRTLEEGQLDASVKMAVRSEFVGEDVIIISDEETERQDRLRLVEGDNNLLPFGQLGGRVSRCVRGMHSLDSDLCREVRDGNFGSQSVFKVGEQVEFVDQAGVVIRGMVCGQTSGDGSIGRAQVLMDFWRAGLDEGNPGYDAHRFSGGLSEVMVHREAGRPAGGQSASVKVRAPLGHRREGRVKSGAVYPTARESVLSGSLGHGAGSVLDEQPSTSRGASARFESTEEEWLDYEEDVEEQVMPALKSVAKGATQSVSEVVRGDRSGNRHLDVAVSNLPRGEELDGGSENFGFGRQVRVASGANFGRGPGGLVSRKGGVDVLIQVDSDSGTGADYYVICGYDPQSLSVEELQGRNEFLQYLLAEASKNVRNRGSAFATSAQDIYSQEKMVKSSPHASASLIHFQDSVKTKNPDTVQEATLGIPLFSVECFNPSRPVSQNSKCSADSYKDLSVPQSFQVSRLDPVSKGSVKTVGFLSSTQMACAPPKLDDSTSVSIPKCCADSCKDLPVPQCFQVSRIEPVSKGSVKTVGFLSSIQKACALPKLDDNIPVSIPKSSAKPFSILSGFDNNMDIHTLKEQFWQIKRQISDFYDEYVVTYTRNLAHGLFSSMHISLLAEPDILFICKVEAVTEQLMETTARQFENLKKENDHQLSLKEQYATSCASPKTAIKQIFPAMNECQETAPVINISASSSDSLSACSLPENIPVQLTESLTSLRDLTPLDSKDRSESSEGSVSAPLSEQIKPKEEESSDADSNSCTLRNQDMTLLEIYGKLCNSVEESESSDDSGSCLAVNKPADSAVQMAHTPQFSDCGDTPALSNNIIEFSDNEETVPVSSEFMDFSDCEEIPAVTKIVRDFSESLKISSVSKQTVEISEKEESQQSETKQPVIRNGRLLLELDTVAASTTDPDLLIPANVYPVFSSTISEEQISELPVSDLDVKSATPTSSAVSLKLKTPETQQSKTEAQVLKDIICPTKTKDLNLNLVFEDLMISTVLSVLLQETIINSKAKAENLDNRVKVTASTGQGGSRVVEIGSCDEIYGEEFDLGTVAGRHARLCGVIAPPPGAVRTRQRGVLGRPAVVGFEQATEDCTTHCLGYSEIVVRRRKPSISLTPTIVIFTEPRGCAQSAALMHHPPF
ncbi:hypothetical protein NDU88_000479 [Pleurodeles waltl]|uniref:Uncharacterized protein n=1 Tax=Pleurodeles waltl TaxID=8319 RepID=A0AAV7VYJ4_PLEWA|nr:hypothetical protein NDU88_000479 [Pleurodeles waltl]